MHSLLLLASFACLSKAACPYVTGGFPRFSDPQTVQRRSGTGASADTDDFLSQFYLNDTDAFMTTDVGGPIEDQNSLSAGDRGPTLLEDFIFRQKIQRFDHERVRVESPFLGPRTGCPCTRCWCPRCLHLLR